MPDLPMADRPEVVLPDIPQDVSDQLGAALRSPDTERRERAGAVVAAHPDIVDGWAGLAPLGRDPIERYAFARVGYHRGLDLLRRHGWGGTGRVRWRHQSNRGFLRCLVALRAAAAEIGEDAEVERIGQLLVDLDPDWDDQWPAAE